MRMAENNEVSTKPTAQVVGKILIIYLRLTIIMENMEAKE